MVAHILTRRGRTAARIVQLALILTALIALLYTAGAPVYYGG